MTGLWSSTDCRLCEHKATNRTKQSLLQVKPNEVSVEEKQDFMVVTSRTWPSTVGLATNDYMEPTTEYSGCKIHLDLLPVAQQFKKSFYRKMCFANDNIDGENYDCNLQPLTMPLDKLMI